jgi:hypothetical protein
MSKHRVLSLKPQLRLEWRGQDGQHETEQPDHSAGLGDSIAASHSDQVFGTHRRRKANPSRLLARCANGIFLSDFEQGEIVRTCSATPA